MNRRPSWWLLSVVGLLASAGLAGCKKKAGEGAAETHRAPVARAVKLGQPQAIPLTPLTMRLAPGWVAERLEGSDVPVPETPPPGMIDLSESVEVWKVTGKSPTGRTDPFMVVTVDRRLPKGTSLAKYLAVLRADQRRQAPGRTLHLETETITRGEREGASIRGTLEVRLPTGGALPLMQVSRVFVDGLLGVAVTALYLEDDRPRIDPEVRAMLESLKFTTRKRVEATEF